MPIRARDLGLPFSGTPGPLNAITDLPGVSVGFCTLTDPSKDMRTGVTAILPRDDLGQPVGVALGQGGVLCGQRVEVAQAVVADGMTNDRPVLLLDMCLVILLVGTRTGEGDLFGLAVAPQGVIDKLTAVIRVQST